jgi:hypothetical protein
MLPMLWLRRSKIWEVIKNDLTKSLSKKQLRKN